MDCNVSAAALVAANFTLPAKAPPGVSRRDVLRSLAAGSAALAPAAAAAAPTAETTPDLIDQGLRAIAAPFAEWDQLTRTPSPDEAAYDASLLALAHAAAPLAAAMQQWVTAVQGHPLWPTDPEQAKDATYLLGTYLSEVFAAAWGEEVAHAAGDESVLGAALAEEQCPGPFCGRGSREWFELTGLNYVPETLAEARALAARHPHRINLRSGPRHGHGSYDRGGQTIFVLAYPVSPRGRTDA